MIPKRTKYSHTKLEKIIHESRLSKNNTNTNHSNQTGTQVNTPSVSLSQHTCRIPESHAPSITGKEGQTDELDSGAPAAARGTTQAATAKSAAIAAGGRSASSKRLGDR